MCAGDATRSAHDGVRGRGSRNYTGGEDQDEE